jgi:cellulose biosynthesis protein BcsQ
MDTLDNSSSNLQPIVVTIANTKGGVGKTIISLNLASGLARVTGLNVLLLDFDPQSSATQALSRFRSDEFRAEGIATALGTDAFLRAHNVARHSLADLVRQPTQRQHGKPGWPPTLFYVPSQPALTQQLITPDTTPGERADQAKPLANKVISSEELQRQLARLSDFAFVIIDTPGSSDPLATLAVQASQFVIIPTLLASYSISELNRAVAQVHSFRHGTSFPQVLGVLYNNVDMRANVQVEGFETADTLLGTLNVRRFETLIPKADCFPRAEHDCVDVFTAPAKTPKGKLCFLAFLQEFAREVDRQLDNDAEHSGRTYLSLRRLVDKGVKALQEG